MSAETGVELQHMAQDVSQPNKIQPKNVDDWLQDDGGGGVQEPEEVGGVVNEKVEETRVDDWLHDENGGATANGHGDCQLSGDSPTEHYGIKDHDFWVDTSRAMMWLTYVLLIVLIVCVLWQFIVHPFESYMVAWVIGAIFVALAVPLSLQDIHMHIIHYISPLQRHYIRILWMVPIYSVESWLALRFNHQKVYLETLREAYEAFVVYSLYKLMREYLGDKQMAVAKLKRIAEKKGSDRATMLFPMCWSYAWRLDAQFLTRSALGVWQYVFIRTALAATSCILEMNHMYGEGSFAPTKFYLWNVIILNLSQCWALWCLVLFYHELREELAPIKPLGKFMVVKAVVFFSWWQQIIVTSLAAAEVIHPTMDYTGEDVAKGIQNLLICIEMLIYALFHKKIFPYTDFKAGGPLSSYMKDMNLRQKSTKSALGEMMPTDVILEGASYVGKAKRLIDNKIHKGPKEPSKLQTAATPEEQEAHDAAALTEVCIDGIEAGRGGLDQDQIHIIPDLLMMDVSATPGTHMTHNGPAEEFSDDDFDPGEGINPFGQTSEQQKQIA